MASDSFSRSARTALVLAYSHARRCSHSCLGSEHILLGLCSLGSGKAWQSLFDAGVRENTVEKQIEKALGRGKSTLSTPVYLGSDAALVIENAAAVAFPKPAEDADLLMSILCMPECRGARIIKECGADKEKICRNLAYNDKTEKLPAKLKLTMQCGIDMTQKARMGEYDPVIGRESESRRVMNILSCRRKSSAVLIGDAGVGKTAVAEALAQRLAKGDVPPVLKGKRLISLDLPGVVSGTKYRGEFEEKLRSIIKEVVQAGDVILFIDEMHLLSGTGAAEGSVDASNIFKPQLARGELQILGATTAQEYKKYIRRDPALSRRFQTVYINEPTPEHTEKILFELKSRYERHHGVSIPADCIKEVLSLSQKYLPERKLPDKAIDLLDEALAAASSEGEEELKREHIACVLSSVTGISAGTIEQSEKELLMSMPCELKKVIVGQDTAVDAVCNAVRRARLLGGGERPKGVFLFCGQPGTGKTKLARELAKRLCPSGDGLIKIDMSEYSEPHSVSKLIGSPPGYTGFSEGGLLTEGIRRRPGAVVLFDEIEKASASVMQLLLQILEEGVLTDSEGNKASFASAFVILTSNLGSTGRKAGFKSGSKEEREKETQSEIKKFLSPELYDRIDEIIVFEPLKEEDFIKIAEMELKQAACRLKENGIALSWDETAPQLLARLGGARKIRAETEKQASSAVAEKWLQGKIESKARLFCRGDKLKAEVD